MLWLKGRKISDHWKVFIFKPSTLVQSSVQTSILLLILAMDTNRVVGDWLGFLLFQLCFAMVFDCLFRLWLNRPCAPQMYIFPMTLSFNLFVWSKPPFLFLQLLMIGVGVAAKNLIKKADGKTHLFNPSAFPLTLSAFLYMIFNFHDPVIAMDTFYRPAMYFPYYLLFVSCFTLWIPNAYAMSAGALFCFTVCLHFTKNIVMPLGGALADLPLDIPGSILLGCTLLVTDPQTSPSRISGKFLFGIAYGLLVTLSVYVLAASPLDPFYIYYSKILPVPILNIFAPQFDHWASRIALFAKGDSFLGQGTAFYFPRLVTMGLYFVAFFSALSWMVCAGCS